MKAVADAERFRRIALAEGEARATEVVFSAIHSGDPTPDLIAIKYLEMLGQVANGRAAKVLPASRHLRLPRISGRDRRTVPERGRRRATPRSPGPTPPA